MISNTGNAFLNRNGLDYDLARLRIVPVIAEPRCHIIAIVIRIILHRSVAFACMFLNGHCAVFPEDDIAVTAEPYILYVHKLRLSSRQRSDIGYECFVLCAQGVVCRTSSINLSLALCGEFYCTDSANQRNHISCRIDRGRQSYVVGRHSELPSLVRLLFRIRTRVCAGRRSDRRCRIIRIGYTADSDSLRITGQSLSIGLVRSQIRSRVGVRANSQGQRAKKAVTAGNNNTNTSSVTTIGIRDDITRGFITMPFCLCDISAIVVIGNLGSVICSIPANNSACRTTCSIISTGGRNTTIVLAIIDISGTIRTCDSTNISYSAYIAIVDTVIYAVIVSSGASHPTYDATHADLSVIRRRNSSIVSTILYGTAV